MNIFDLLAEWNIIKWQKNSANKTVEDSAEQTSAADGETGFGKPYKGHLLDDVRAMISEAYQQEDDERKQALLDRAKELETQLLMSYEKQGYHMLAASTQELIREHRKDAAHGRKR